MDLFQLLGTISINNADANDALDDTSKKGQETESKLSKGFKAIGKGAVAVGKTIATGLAVGATAMGALTIKALNLSGELEQNMGGSEAVFGEHADKMQAKAKEAFSNMGLSTSDFLATANKMGALFQGAGFSIEESSNIASDAMQRAADVASIMGIDTSSAMEAIAGAAKGNFTMMDNLGVAMNDTTLNAYALEKGINKTTQEMTNQEKIALAMEMFMEKTAYAAGNYAKENETLAGSLGTAKAALTNFLDGSGDVDQLVTAFGNSANVIIKNVKEIAPRLISGITDIVNQVIPMLPPLLQEILPVIIEGAVNLINGLVTALPMIINALMGALPALIQGVQQIFVALVNALPQLLQTIVMALPALIQTIMSALPTLIPLIINALVSMIVTICTMFSQIIQPIIDNLPNIIISIVNAIMSNLPILIQGLITLVLAIVTAIPQIIQALVDALPMVMESIVVGLLGTLPLLLKGFIDLVAGVVKAIDSIWGSFKQGLVNYFKGIWSGITKVFAPVGEWFSKVFSQAWEGVKKIFSGVGEFFAGIWDTIKTTFTNLGTTIGDAISGAVKAGINALIGSAENIINGFFGLINGAIDMINKIPNVNISKIKLVEFTRLAKGGVVDEPTPAIFGEDGAEAVVPLENNTGWLNKVALRLHELNAQHSGLDGLSMRSIELQNAQVSELHTLNNTAFKILEAILTMDENMGGHMREALDGVSLDINKREFARLVRGAI